MAPRSIALTEDEDRLIDGLVETGRFADADDVVGEALRLLVGQETVDDETRLARLRTEVQLGSDSIARGEYQEFATVDDLVLYLDRLGDEIISGRLDE